MPDQGAAKRLALWGASFHGLLWYLEITRSRLHVLNEWQHPLLGEHTARLLKDSHYRKDVVHPDDLLLLSEFWDVVATRSPAEVLFRLRESPESRFLLQGWPHTSDNTMYSGMLQDVTVLYDEREQGLSRRNMLFRASYPVLVVDMQTGLISLHNQAADKLFGFDRRAEQTNMAFEMIAPALQGGNGKPVRQLARHDPNQGVWAGTMSFCTVHGVPFQAEVRLSAYETAESQYVRVAFLHMPQNVNDMKKREEAALLEAVKQAPDLQAALDALLRAPLPYAVDGVLFSDIKSAKGVVQVYGVGAPFQSMEWGATYTYEGTIAQDIERFGLPYLSIDDALDSIKSIDWVLFNPYGIRSYFAKPFYQRGVLQAILILASCTPYAFASLENEQIQAETCAMLYEPFKYAVQAWRTAQRTAIKNKKVRRA